MGTNRGGVMAIYYLSLYRSKQCAPKAVEGLGEGGFKP